MEPENSLHDELRQVRQIQSIQRATLDATADGILVVSNSGLIVTYNQRLLDIWGIPASAVEGRSYQESLRMVMSQLEDPESCVRHLEAIMADREAFSHDRIVFKSGKILERFSRPQHLDGVTTGRVFSYRDITERVRAENSAKKNEERINTLAEVTRLMAEARLDLQTILDSATHTVSKYFNDSCLIRLIEKNSPELNTVAYYSVDAEIYELLRHTVVGFRELIDPAAVARVMSTKEPLLLSGDLSQMRDRVNPKLQPIFDQFPVHSWVMSPMRVAGEVIGFLTVFRTRPEPYSKGDIDFIQDLSDRAGLAVSNAIYHQMTESALRMRDDFILLASHELRTPLTALTLQLHLLEKKTENAPEVAPVVARAAGSVTRMSEMVRTMLEMAGLASGSTALRVEEADLVTLIREVIESVQSKMAGSKCSIRFVPDSNLSVRGHWDRERLRDALQNLLNAMLIPGAGRPIDIQLSRTPTRARIEIRAGELHADQCQATHLGRMQQAERTDRTQLVEQLGLGVYVANEIIEGHQGWFRIHGDLAHEFAFVVELPAIRMPQN